jgi:hypothetical protein
MARFPEPTDRYPALRPTVLPDDEFGQLASKKTPPQPPATRPKRQQPTRAATKGEKLEQVAKYIPAEVLGGYAWVCGQINAGAKADESALRYGLFGFVFLLALALTPLFVAKVTTDHRFLRMNQGVATVAFVVWAFSYPIGLFHDLGWDRAPLPYVILATFLLITALIEPKPAK